MKKEEADIVDEQRRRAATNFCSLQRGGFVRPSNRQRLHTYRRNHQRRVKTHYNSVYYGGLARNRPYLKQMIRASAVEELGLFDKDCLVRCLRQAALGIVSPNGAIGLDNSLSIVKWLELLPQWLARRPKPTHVLRSIRREIFADRMPALVERAC